MSIFGNAIMLGGGGISTELNTFVGFIWAKCQKSSWVTVDNDSSVATYANVDSDYFTYSAGVFTCAKAGNYNIKVLGVGNRKGSGAPVRFANYQLILNHSGTDTTISTYDGTVYMGLDGTVDEVSTATLSVGDTLTLKGQSSGNTTGEITLAMTISVTPAAQDMSGSNNVLGCVCSNTPSAGTANTYYLIGVSDSQAVLSACDTGEFSYSAGYFTAEKTGTYTVNLFSSATRDNSGNNSYTHIKLVKTSGGTDTDVYTISTDIPLAGAVYPVQVSVNAGDKLSIWAACTRGNGSRGNAGMAISVV